MSEQDNYARTHDLNGFGDRVSRVEREQSAIGVRVERNESDIQRLFDLSGENAESISKLSTSLSGLINKIVLSVAAVVTAIGVVFQIINSIGGKP